MKLEHARQLVRLHGADAVACQILNPGIDHWFAAANDAVVGFVRRHKVRVVAGSAVCAADRLADVALEFERDAAAGERVCYFGAEAPLGGTLSQSAHAFPRPSGCPTSMAHRALSLQCCMPRLSQGPTQPCPQQGGHCFRVAGRARERGIIRRCSVACTSGWQRAGCHRCIYRQLSCGCCGKRPSPAGSPPWA